MIPTINISDNPIVRIGFGLMILSVVGGALLALLPTSVEYPMPPAFAGAMTWLFQTLWAWDFLIPTQTLISVFYIVLFTDVMLVFVRLTFLAKKIATSVK